MSTSTLVSLDEQIASFKESGFAVLRQLFSQEDIDVLRDAFMEEARNGPVEGLSEMVRHDGTPFDPSDPLAFYPRMVHPHRHPEKRVGRLAMKYMLDRRLYQPLKSFMEDEPIAVQSMFYFKPPGARGQALHQDNFYLRVKPGTCCAAWVAVDDADRDNGGMVVVPGTQDMELVCPEKTDLTKFFTDHHVPVPEGLTEQAIDLKAGDVLFFNGSLIHGSYPNTHPTRFRRSFICHYAPMHARELATFYKERLTFDGDTVHFDDATGGGPCGGDYQPAKPH